MNIIFDEKNKTFKLDTKNSSYVISIVDEEGFVGHSYYGKKISDSDVSYLLRINENPFVPSKNRRDRGSFFDSFFTEYASNGVGDYRESAIAVRDKNGHTCVSLTYKDHKIYDGKPALKGLPATFGKDSEVKTLELVCEDKVLNLEVTLLYSVFEGIDAVVRSARVKNLSEDKIVLTKVMSLCLDMEAEDKKMLTLHGSWARERQIDIRPIGYGKTSVGSINGESSHQEHPFMALLSENCTQEEGEAIGFSFVYSGNFIMQSQKTQFDALRVICGIHPSDFAWNLESGEEFVAPEVVMVYSANGLGEMSRNYHDLYRNHLIRSPYKDKKRPILINNWEATYFDFNTEKLLSIARSAKENGIEMLVMDDGWFGKRNSDNCSLGDWFVNEEKINGGLKYLVDEVNKIGLKFGIWVEPEMISPDSDLYRAHPDWAIAIEDRVPTQSREQYVLDLSRVEVRDYVFKMISDVLHSANIEYVKWDMNRQITDLGSYFLDKEHQGELFHRFVLGMYDLQERLVTEFPDLLLENCSGGGARFDAGMLYFSPQIWCSDDTDAIERLKIQEGTSIVYPLSCMGAHVSDCPNHTVGRVTPFETRGNVALAGTFGYELDITKISEDDRNQIKGQTVLYHKYNDLVRNGDYYRIASYSKNNEYDCWGVISKDKKEALFTFVQVLNRPNFHSRRLKLKGLDPNKKYIIKDGWDNNLDAALNTKEGEPFVISGDTLMNAGINMPNPWGDFGSKLLHVVEA